MDKGIKEYAGVANRILLALLMLISGLLKLFVIKPSGVVGMLTGLSFPAPTFFAWILIGGEIIFGLLILVKWKIEYVVYGPIIILAVAMFKVAWGQWSSVLMHLVIISNYWLLGVKAYKN